MKIIMMAIGLLSSCAFSSDIPLPNIVVKDDGSTNYEEIFCSVKEGSIVGGIVLDLAIDKSISPECMDLFVIKSNGENAVYCGVEGRERGNEVQYRVQLAREFFKHSELWIMTKKTGRISLHFSQFEKGSGVSEREGVGEHIRD